MRILIVRNFPSFMDVKHNTYNIQEVGLAKALVRKGHTCDIVFWTDKREKKEIIDVGINKTVTVFYRHGKAILKNVIYTGIDELVKKYDIVQSSEYNQIQSLIFALKYPDKTVIYHGPYYSQFNNRYNLMCKILDWFIVPIYKNKKTLFLTKSNLAKEFLIEKGISKLNIITTGVGIDLDAFISTDSTHISKDVFNIDTSNDKLKLLYIGRIEHRRNIPFLFNVLKRMIELGIDSELVIIGDGDSKYCKKCFEYASQLGVDDNIHRIKKAQQKYLSYAYKNTDVFLLPTYYEIFGMVLLEAMYFGKPVITTTNGGSEMLINDGTNGIVIDDFDVDKWCDAIVRLKDNKEIGIIAHKTISENFTWDLLCDLFIEIYEKRLNETI